MKTKKDLLERVSARVLEDAAFVFAMPREEPPPAPDEWAPVGVRLTFRGPFGGYCEIWAPPALAKILSANMLGVDEDTPDAQETYCDALKETLNILCGNLLTEMAGEDPVFDLKTPTVQERLEPLPTDDSSVEIWLDADGHPILIRARIDDDAFKAA